MALSPLHQRDIKEGNSETHETVVPGEKYLPSLGNTVSSDLVISSVARIATIDIQRELKAMWRPGQILIYQRRARLTSEDYILKLKDAPSAKAKDYIPRISNFLVKSTIFDEAFRLERFSIGIDFLVTSHAPVNALI